MALIPGPLRMDPVRGYNFLILLIDQSDPISSALGGIQNLALGGFSECSGLEMTLEIEERAEGGNHHSVRKFPTRVAWKNIVLKRGVALSDDLWNWHYDFALGKGAVRSGVIVLQDDLKIPRKIWFFERGLPVRWSGPSMNAQESQVAVEEIEIAHEGLRSLSPAAMLNEATGVSF